MWWSDEELEVREYGEWGGLRERAKRGGGEGRRGEECEGVIKSTDFLQTSTGERKMSKWTMLASTFLAGG